MLRTLFAGDVMLGRGIQLSMPHQSPGETSITDSVSALHYFKLALHFPYHRTETDTEFNERAEEIKFQNSKGKWLAGDMCKLIFNPPPDLRIFNLETSMTESIQNDDVPLKGINYHFHVGNAPVLFEQLLTQNYGQANRTIPCALSYSNNHCMDFGRLAFTNETLPFLSRFSNLHKNILQSVGAGDSYTEAAKPAEYRIKNRLIQVFAVATECSGTPSEWSARRDLPGIIVLPSLTSLESVRSSMQRISEIFGLYAKKGALKVVSIHWGPNWAEFAVDPAQKARRELAHRLIDQLGVDIIFGHSSHHIRGLEMHSNKLIIYGAGDLINDYEGFEGILDYRYGQLKNGLLLVDVDQCSGDFKSIRIIPTFMNQLRIKRFVRDSEMWLPTLRVMKKNPDGLEELCSVINQLSRYDSQHSVNAIRLEVVEADESCPGGPILRNV